MKRLRIGLTIFAMILLLGGSSVHGESIVYGGGQILVKGADTKSVGAGSMVSFGQQVSPKLIFWIPTINAFKTGEAVSVDNGYVGFTVFSGELIPKFKGELFLTIQGGFGKVEDDNVMFANLTSGGFMFPFSDRCKGYVGGSLSNDGELTVYSAHIGISTSLDFSFK